MRTAFQKPAFLVHHGPATQILHRFLNFIQLFQSLVLTDCFIHSVGHLTNFLARLPHLSHCVVNLCLLIVLLQPYIARIECSSKLLHLPIDISLLKLAVLFQELLEQHAITWNSLHWLNQ